MGATEAATNISAEVEISVIIRSDIAAARRVFGATPTEFGARSSLAETIDPPHIDGNETSRLLHVSVLHASRGEEQVEQRANALSETPEDVVELKREVQVKEREIDDLRSMCHEHEESLKQYQSESNQEMEALKLHMLEFEELLQAHTTGSRDTVSTQCWSPGQKGDLAELSSVGPDSVDASAQHSVEASQLFVRGRRGGSVPLGLWLHEELQSDVPLRAPNLRPSSPARNGVTNFT
eukprot:CAMPEP_0117618468 /NCGR_PEP_ID=MMETSP0784-20121206/86120_1 /TAXON_ID=39447 /ORGANISM="" /LENGTH=236 /DNA_ID=CAMNT_0005422335 /DNA_START=1 /DNA_END=709 /DNA_ORIENTATION=-